MHAFNAHGNVTLLAWVLMPDHAHWLLQLDQSQTLSQAVNHLKTSSARAANRQRSCTGPLWARAFHDRALRREDDLQAAARYVITNPIRAGLVCSVGDYPFWNCVYL